MIKFYNSLTLKKEEFKPLNKDHIKMYVCGPTVYNYIHIGNARSIIVFDVLYRLLKHKYEKVSYVRNITDIDDKIIKKANAENKTSDDIALEYTNALHEDLKNLNILPPSIEPKATEHVQSIIEIIQDAIKNGYAYESQGNVLFDIRKYDKYGTLVNLSKNKTIAGKRVEVEEYKENPEDFVLWKPSKENEPYWASPWGNGRPGWHVECSAMSRTCLGERFDIHGGGQDLKFPHHENEIAISSCVSHHDVSANYWLHNGFLTIKDEKMSKSLNNFITLRQALQSYGGGVLKIAMLLSQYRQPLNFDNKLITLATNICKKIYLSVYEDFATTIELQENFEDSNFINALQDDLNTALALTHLQKGLAKNKVTEIAKQLDILGLSIDLICLNMLKNNLESIHTCLKNISGAELKNQSIKESIALLIKNIENTFSKNAIENSFNLTHSLFLLQKIASSENIKLDSKTIENINLLNSVFENKEEIEKLKSTLNAKTLERLKAKEDKDYKKSDEIRNQLALEYRVKIVDTSNNQSYWTID